MTLTTLWRRINAVLAWPGLLGVALLVAAGGVYLYRLQPQTAQLAQLQRDSASLKTRIEQAAKSGIAETSDQDELAKFYAFFSDTPLADWLDKVYAAAADQHVVLLQGEYRVVPAKNSRLMRYQITFPVKGSYLQIRQFVAQVMEDVPVAALDDITFKREAIGAGEVETRVKLTLFLGAEGTGAH